MRCACNGKRDKPVAADRPPIDSRIHQRHTFVVLLGSPWNGPRIRSRIALRRFLPPFPLTSLDGFPEASPAGWFSRARRARCVRVGCSCGGGTGVRRYGGSMSNDRSLSLRPAARSAPPILLLLFSCLVLFLTASGGPAGAAVTAFPAVCIDPVPVNPPPAALTPWSYKVDDGEYLWGDHEFYEDPGNTVFSLVRDLVSLGSQQPAAYQDVLLFNFAQFDPPEGVATTPSMPRRLMTDSLEAKGLQLYVNYSDALIDPAYGDRYFKPTFFVSLDGTHQNKQTIPPVPMKGFSVPFVSATRGAFGCAFAKVKAQTVPTVPVDTLPFEASATPAGSIVAEPILPACDELYVTAGLPYGLADMDSDPAQQVLATQAQTDLLMKRDPATGVWKDVA